MCGGGAAHVLMPWGEGRWGCGPGARVLWEGSGGQWLELGGGGGHLGSS